jgi:hypothetical protein
MPLLDDRYKKSKTSRPSLGQQKVVNNKNIDIQSVYSVSNEIQSLDKLQTIKKNVDIKAKDKDKALVRVSGFKIPAGANVVNAFSIAENEGLSGLMFSHYDTTSQADSIISLAWTFDASSDLTITEGSSGIINTSAVTKGTLYRILTTTIPNSSAFSLPQDIIMNFKNLSKKIYFYVSASVDGVEMTIFKN